MYPVGPTTSTLISLGALERYAPLAAAWHCSLEDRWGRGLEVEVEKATLDSCMEGNIDLFDRHFPIDRDDWRDISLEPSHRDHPALTLGKGRNRAFALDVARLLAHGATDRLAPPARSEAGRRMLDFWLAMEFISMSDRHDHEPTTGKCGGGNSNFV